MLFVFLFQMHSVNLYFYYYRCQSPHRGASSGMEKLPRNFQGHSLCSLNLFYSHSALYLSCSRSVTQTCGHWIQCVFYGHTGKVWRLQTKPQPCQACEGRRGPFLRKSSQSPNNRAVPAWGWLSGQWSMVSVSDACPNWPVANKEGQI